MQIKIIGCILEGIDHRRKLNFVEVHFAGGVVLRTSKDSLILLGHL